MKELVSVSMILNAQNAILIFTRQFENHLKQKLCELDVLLMKIGPAINTILTQEYRQFLMNRVRLSDMS